VLAYSPEPNEGRVSVKFRKGQTNDKDVFIEVWNAERGFVSSLKVTDKLKLVYNDTLFGPISWSRDATKIVFIAELSDVTTYKTYFKDPEEPKSEEEKKKEEEEKKKDTSDEHW